MIERQGERCYVSGAVTHATVVALLSEGEKLFGQGRLIFDFSGVESVDSSSLSLMLEWMRRAALVGTALAFANLGPAIRSLIDLYGLAELIPLTAE
ncbi:MAG TPA: STAS domain-containing protein [Burkholderiales bacterium]|jgi:phospholipid transport system transporter-binding protein|nr:STAS domain-containing protein [Burkholderiales bacterium]